MRRAIICDTSIWLYLGRIGHINLLLQLYQLVYTTEFVCQELDVGRVSRPDTMDPRQLSWVTIVQPTAQEIAHLPANRLGLGEQSVLAYAHGHQMDVVGLDDQQARRLAHLLRLRVVGTIGLLLQAKEAQVLGEIRPLLEQLPREGFYIGEELLAYALQRAKEG